MPNPDKNYRNPPIQEAICEIHFELNEPLSLEKIELLKPKWSADYADQKTVQERRVDFHLSPEGLQTKEGNLGHRLICKSADGKRYHDALHRGRRLASFTQTGFSFLLIKLTTHFARPETSEVTRRPGP